MMAKQQFNFSLSASQLTQACEAYVAGMVDPEAYDIEASVKQGSHVMVKATKRRARKAKAPKVAAVKAAA
jgi:hypothetical protein